MKHQEAIGTLETLLMVPTLSNFTTLKMYPDQEPTAGRKAIQEIPIYIQFNLLTPTLMKTSHPPVPKRKIKSPSRHFRTKLFIDEDQPPSRT